MTVAAGMDRLFLNIRFQPIGSFCIEQALKSSNPERKAGNWKLVVSRCLLKMRFNLLQRLALGFRQKEHRYQEVHNGKAGKEEEH